MDMNIFLVICLLFVVKINCQYIDDTIELQILRELSQEGKKCIRTSGEIIFILDGSTSVGPDNFNKEKNFATEIVDKLVIGKNLTRVALITYNSIPSLVFNLDKFNNSKDVNKEIQKAEFTEGITVVGDALNMVLTDIEPKTRKSTGKVVILISDGKRNGGMDPVLVAKQLKATSYLILTIGLDKDTDENAMIAISSKKDFYSIKSFDALSKIVSTIVLKTCTEFHISKCPKRTQEKGKCIDHQQVIIIKSHYYVNGKCIPEQRKVTVKCVPTGECPKSYYQKTPCGSSNHSYILFHNFTRKNNLCSQTTENLKKVPCGCPKSEENVLKVVHAKECVNGSKKRMLVYHEFSQFKCSETYLNLLPVKCSSLCVGTVIITSQCLNGKRNNTLYKRNFVNNTCSMTVVKTTESHCDTQCPKSIIIESKTCVNNQKDVYHITFENKNGKCIKQTRKLKSVNCTNVIVCPKSIISSTECNQGQKAIMKTSYRVVGTECKQVIERIGMEKCNETRCSKSTYRVEKCEKGAKETFLIGTFYRKQNGKCVKGEQKLKRLSCLCYNTTTINVTVSVSKQCINGFTSKMVEINEEKNQKCVKISFALRRVKCKNICNRKRQLSISTCKSNKRTISRLHQVREGQKCVWKIIRSKNITCQNVCPEQKEKRSRCTHGKQSVMQITFKQVGDVCKYNLTRIQVINCTGCPRSTYHVEKCEKDAKNTSLIRTFYQELNGKCERKTKKVKQLSCKCQGTISKNISITFGKQCKNGHLARFLEYTEERNDKCVKVLYKLRRIKCRKPCSRRSIRVVSKCKANSRTVKIMKAVREGNKCSFKPAIVKVVKCKNPCPTNRERTSRCIRGKKAIIKVLFKEVRDECKITILRLSIVPCKKCQNGTYRIETCNKNDKQTSLIQTFYEEQNGVCTKKERKIKTVACRCYENKTRNINVIVGKQCKDGYISRILELNEERNGQCVKVSFSLRRIRCQRSCSRKPRISIGKCVANKRIINRMKALKENNKCVFKVISSKTVQCKNVCPTSKERKSECIGGKQKIIKVTFKEIKNECKFMMAAVNESKCKECPRSSYRVEKCDKNVKDTSLIKTFYRESNGICVKAEKIVKKLSCRCYDSTTKNITVTIGKQCQNGYLSRVLELNEERNNKCVKVSFTLRRIRCHRSCSRKMRLVVSKCKSNQRVIQRLRHIGEGQKCVWKVVGSKTVKCQNPCPLPKERKSHCIRGKQSVIKITFTEVKDECKFNMTRINKLKDCKRCPRSTYWVEKCNGNKNETFLILSFYRETNGTCMKREKKVKRLSCRCYKDELRNITVTVGKQCRHGFRSRALEIMEERNNRCIKVSYTLRRIRCHKPCGKRSSFFVGKCKENKRIVNQLQFIRQGSNCVWKVISSKTVKCKNSCPSVRQRKSRCIRGKQTISKISFTDVGNQCNFTVILLNTTKCQACPRSTYRIDKCDKNAKETSLIRSFYQEINGTCNRKENKLQTLSCRCYIHRSLNISVTLEKECRNGLQSRKIEFEKEQSNKCVTVSLKLKSIQCKVQCNKERKNIEKCVNNKQIVKIYKQIKQDGKCSWKLFSTQSVNCTTSCPTPKTTTTPCINGRRYLIRISFNLVGQSCQKREQKLKFMSCRKCFKRTIYEITKCSKSIPSSQLIRITHNDCTRKVEKLNDVDCSCESYNEQGLNLTFTSQCIGGMKHRTLSYFNKVNGKCLPKLIDVKSGKCGCFGSTYTMSTCVKGNRTFEKITKYQSGQKCLSRSIFNRKLRCKSVCPEKLLILTRKCFENRKLNVYALYEQSGAQCKLIKLIFKWIKCVTPISGKTCKKNYYNLSVCRNGVATVFYTKFDNNTCANKSEEVDKIACKGTCERIVRPKLVSGQCSRNVKQIFFIKSRPQGEKCISEIKYLGQIPCKNC